MWNEWRPDYWWLCQVRITSRCHLLYVAASCTTLLWQHHAIGGKTDLSISFVICNIFFVMYIKINHSEIRCKNMMLPPGQLLLYYQLLNFKVIIFFTLKFLYLLFKPFQGQEYSISKIMKFLTDIGILTRIFQKTKLYFSTLSV